MMNRKYLFISLVLFAGSAALAEEGTIRAKILPVAERQTAKNFQLNDKSGQEITINGYAGKVLLLDFWATWCGGCKHEIPWFEEFNKAYGNRGLAVLGVSLDDDGWKVLRPFLVQKPISYPIVLGDPTTAKLYGIDGMPDTFLIDRRGRLAAAYRAGVVDKQDMEANIKLLLSEK